MNSFAVKSRSDTGAAESSGGPCPAEPTGPARQVCGDGVIEKMSEPVMRRLIDYMLLPPSKADPQQQVHAMDILLRAVDTCPVPARRQLSLRISRLRSRGQALAARLARDCEISVAAPLLLETTLLSDHDLVAIVETGDVERCKLVAARRDVSTAVSAALVAAGHLSATRLVLENRSARFSHDTMAQLIALAPGVYELHRPLLSRLEMTAQYALELFWHLGPPLRENVLLRYLGGCHVVRSLLDPDCDSTPNGMPHKPPRAVCGGGDDYKRKLELIVENIEDGKIALGAKKLGKLLSIPEKLARKLIGDESGEPVAVAFKAVGATRAQFRECAFRWAQSAKAPLSAERDSDGLAGVFERLSRDQARMAITYWQWQLEDSGG